MAIKDVLGSAVVLHDLGATDKAEAIKEMVAGVVRLGRLPEDSARGVVRALMKRERDGSTGVGQGVGIPHDKVSSGGDFFVLAVARSKKGVAYEALDGEPVFLLFLVLSSEQHDEKYFAMLRFIVDLMRNENNVKFLRQAKEEDVGPLLSEIYQGQAAKVT